MPRLVLIAALLLVALSLILTITAITDHAFPATESDGRSLTASSAVISLANAGLLTARGSVGGSSRPTTSAAYSPDGAIFAAGSADTGVYLWKAATGEALAVLEGHRGNVNALAFSPDGKTLASASDDGMVRLWDAATGQLRSTIRTQKRNLSLTFSADGQTLVKVALDGTIQMWDVATGAPSSPSTGLTLGPYGAALVLTGERGTTRLRDLAFNKQIVYGGHVGPIYDVKLSPDGSTLASAGSDGEVLLWNVASGQSYTTGQTVPITLTAIAIRRLAFSPDSSLLASVSDDGTVRLWNARTGTQLAALASHDNLSYGLAFSPDGTTLAAPGPIRDDESTPQYTVQFWQVAG